MKIFIKYYFDLFVIIESIFIFVKHINTSKQTKFTKYKANKQTKV